MCFILIKYFMYFRGIIVISQYMRDQTAKRTSLLNSGRSKILGGAQKEKWHCSHVRYCLRYYLRHYLHRRINDVALTDEVSWFCWTKILMHCWWWRGNILVDKKIHVRYMQHMGLFSTKPHGQTVLLFTHTVDACYWLMTWRNPERPNCF